MKFNHFYFSFYFSHVLTCWLWKQSLHNYTFLKQYKSNNAQYFLDWISFILYLGHFHKIMLISLLLVVFNWNSFFFNLLIYKSCCWTFKKSYLISLNVPEDKPPDTDRLLPRDAIVRLVVNKCCCCFCFFQKLIQKLVQPVHSYLSLLTLNSNIISSFSRKELIYTTKQKFRHNWILL